ncbi:MAG: hypothetical protein EXQ70_06040 [Solirubrobacterales bacterium]|nr:hypothetical protein [Solirubrobacterales bacterium]
MRNRKFVVGALASIMALGVYGIAQADESTQTQTMYGDAAPVKVPKKGFQGLKKFDIGVETLNPAPDGRPGGLNDQPFPSTRTILDFDNDIKFTIKSVPYNQVNKNNSLGQCTATIDGKSAAEATSLCSKALVGSGDAEANLFGTLIPATVTAFNGAPVGGKPVILLHSDPGQDAFVLPGTLSKSNQGSDFGMQLDVNPIPPLTAGTAITNFHTDVGGLTYKRKGTKYPYVSARCADKNKTWNFHGEFFFDTEYDGSAFDFTLEADATQACKVKPQKK